MQRNSMRRGPHNRGMLTALLRTFSWRGGGPPPPRRPPPRGPGLRGGGGGVGGEVV